MKVMIKDYRKNTIVLSEKIFNCAVRLTSLLEEYDFRGERAEIDRHLVNLSVYANRLEGLVMPIDVNNAPMNLFEAMKKPVLSHAPVIIDKENPDLDFKDWFCEKISRIKTATYKLMDNLAQEPDQESVKYIRSINNYLIIEITRLTKNIAELFLSGRLLIQDLIVEMDEE
ncbi:MAG: hypothetical protein ACMUJM_01485 [bacterium]